MRLETVFRCDRRRFILHTCTFPNEAGNLVSPVRAAGLFEGNSRRYMSVLFIDCQCMRRNTMPLVTQTQRVFFAVICVAALLVAVLGLFNPGYLASIFTWLELPPLHARFVGAIYAFGAVFMAGCLVARYQAEVRWAVQLIGIWTGMLFI